MQGQKRVHRQVRPRRRRRLGPEAPRRREQGQIAEGQRRQAPGRVAGQGEQREEARARAYGDPDRRHQAAVPLAQKLRGDIARRTRHRHRQQQPEDRVRQPVVAAQRPQGGGNQRQNGAERDKQLAHGAGLYHLLGLVIAHTAKRNRPRIAS